MKTGQPFSAELLGAHRVIREPVAFENGYWAGAPGAFYSAEEKAWYLTYRIRRPRGVPPDRGGEARIARSTDLVHWDDVWQITKDQFSSASIERCALRKRPDGEWRYFASYVDPEDGRWCVSVLKARSIDELNPPAAEPLFRAGSIGLEGVKDPWIYEMAGAYFMFLSVAVPTAATREESHATLDIYNTGECVSATALATSRDLDKWEWQGIVFQPAGSGWDRYCRRINSVIAMDGKFLAFYDGSASHAENYEERTGSGLSSDLRQWKTLTPEAPLLTSPHGSGSLRYVDAQLSGNLAYIFYEFCRADGAHELRMSEISADTFTARLTECCR